MLQNSVGVVDANCATRMDRGGWTKPICALLVSGLIYIGRWTRRGDTIDFLLSPKRDAAAAKRFFQKALRSLNHPRPRVVNVDGNPAYPKVIDDLKRSRELGRRCRCRPLRCLNNIVEQDHRAIKTQGSSHARLPVISRGEADDSRYRNGAHD